MAVPRKGWRKISVEGRVFHWRANGQDWGIEVVVATENAFAEGKEPNNWRSPSTTTTSGHRARMGVWA